MSTAIQSAEDTLDSGVVVNTCTQYLTFWLSDEIYGINISTVKEIIEYGGVTYVPAMPDFIAGVMNLRGSVVPVINLAKRFGKDPFQTTKKTSVVIVEIDNEGEAMEVGVIVDKVNEVLDIIDDNIEPAPTFGAKIRASFISGMGKVNGDLLVLLDVTRVLSVNELSVVNNVSEPVNEDAPPSIN